MLGPPAGEALTRLTPPARSGAGEGLEVLQQKDNLCGPFHAARILRDAGLSESGGEPLDQDLVALRAGTVLPVREDGPQVPPGALSITAYRYELPRVDPAASGSR